MEQTVPEVVCSEEVQCRSEVQRNQICPTSRNYSQKAISRPTECEITSRVSSLPTTMELSPEPSVLRNTDPSRFSARRWSHRISGEAELAEGWYNNSSSGRKRQASMSSTS